MPVKQLEKLDALVRCPRRRLRCMRNARLVHLCRFFIFESLAVGDDANEPRQDFPGHLLYPPGR